ncbi:MAG: acyl dehydratase, partial [Burkholderiaceae bacterium]|nr:acyl dehydratase [Burkholderiaceae bacterium]
MTTAAPFPPQREQRWFEDYRPGLVLEFGAIPVDEGEVIEFARRYDPQPFHIDAEAAAQGAYGGLIASGWHTGSLMMRLLVEHFLPGQAGLASPGVDELRWLAPVRPGDSLSLRLTVT